MFLNFYILLPVAVAEISITVSVTPCQVLITVNALQF